MLGGATREDRGDPWDLAQARHVDASAILAGMLEEELRSSVTMSPRPLQQAPLRVLIGANMPAALVEMALSDESRAGEGRAHARRIRTLIAQALYDAIVRFRAYLDGAA